MAAVDSGSIDYRAPTTVAAFLRSPARFRVIKGPFGSGKSVGCCMGILKYAMEQQPGKDGYRRTQWAVVRNTVKMLVDTTIKTWLEWIPDGVYGYYRSSTKDFYLEFNDVRAQIMFRALDDAADVRNLLSLELTGAWLNECKEIHPDLITPLRKRTGRYPPSRNSVIPTWYGVIADTNPPDIDSWWYGMMEKQPGFENDWEVFHQPSGRSPLAENVENLPDNYYDTTGMAEDEIRTMVDGLYGRSKVGQPVFGKDFTEAFHVSSTPLHVIKDFKYPLIIGIDFGLTPAAVFCQLTPSGQIRVLDEITTHKEGSIGMRQFVPRYLKPKMLEKFRGFTFTMVGDPAGVAGSQGDASQTCYSVLRELGFDAYPARTNYLESRLEAVRKALARQVNGQPGLLIDPGCKTVVAAFGSGYAYHKRSNGIIDPEPCKTGELGKYSHPMDALQYALMHIDDYGASRFDEDDNEDYDRHYQDRSRNRVTGY